MKAMRPLFLLLLTVFLSACTGKSSGPTDAEARAALEQQIKDFSQGCIKLVEFHRTGEKALGNVIIVDANAKVEFLEDCNWPIETSVMVLKTPPGGTSNVKKGDLRTLNIDLQFVETEHGWKSGQKKDTGSNVVQ